ncbi:MAG TPA: hypothetical protein VFG62_11705 [Rhodopila sp.]|nr:hypothetical protein [Rhodopila sp.]
MAGAVAYAEGNDPAAAATTLASINGFGTGAVDSLSTVAGAASSTVSASPSASDPSRIEVDIGVDFPTYLAALFHATDITVNAHAAANIQPKGQACLLSTTGDLTIGMGVVGTYFTKCFLASNATDTTAVTISNSNSIYVRGITARGGISRPDCSSGACPSIDPLWGATDWTNGYEYDRPDAAYQVPTTNPFLTVPASSYPAFADITCPDPAAFGMTYDPPNPPLGANNCPTVPTTVTMVTASATVPPTQPDTADGVTSVCGATFSGICAFYNMDVAFSGNVTLQPGTYLFLNSSLTVADGAQVACSITDGHSISVCGQVVPGVTIVLAGVTDAPSQDAGRLYIEPGASVQLTAASTAMFAPASLNGVLFYRDPTNLPADSAGSPSVAIADNLTNSAGPSTLEGVMFFPGANVWFAANVSEQPVGNEPNCDVVVAGTLNIGYWAGLTSQGNSSYYANFSGVCSGVTSLPVVQAPVLVE